MAASLGRLGITPRKSLTLEPPALRSDLMRHFWRGEFDGDGCLSLNTSSGQWVATLVGSRGMVDAFSSYARTVCTSKATVRTTKRVYAVQVGGNRACLALMASLYDGATVYLDRKRDLYLRALGDRIPRKPPHGRPTAHDDRGEPAALG